MFALVVQTDDGSYQHGYHLGTDEWVARDLAEEICVLRRPRIGTHTVRVELLEGGRLVDEYDGLVWSSELTRPRH